MKKKIISSILAASFFVFVGCGSNNLDDSTLSTETIKVTASDAYVVALPDPAVMSVPAGDGQIYFYSTNVEANGTIIFNVPVNIDLTNAKVYIPDTAIVDADGNGVLSDKDQVIRMPLMTMLDGNATGTVANPLTTIALENNDILGLALAEQFDPIKAKVLLAQNYNETLAKLVVLNDAIADYIKESVQNGLSVQEALQNIKVTNLADIILNQSIDPITAVNTVFNNATDPQVLGKVILNLSFIQEANYLVQNGEITPHDAFVGMVALSEADINTTVVQTALQDKNISEIINAIPENPKVKEFINENF